MTSVASPGNKGRASIPGQALYRALCEAGSPDDGVRAVLRHFVPCRSSAPLAASPVPANFPPQAVVRGVSVQEDVLFFSAPAGEIRYKFPFAVDNIFQM